MANQLYTGQSNKIFPYNYMENIKDKETNKSLLEVLSGFNSYFLAYTGDAESTRLSVPKLVRHEGLFISYIDYNNNHITEYYRGSDINDKEWQKSSNWRLGNNTFMGELSISSNGTWVINNEDTGIPARGETGTTPLMRFGDNNKFQVSYNNGDAWEDISNEITSQLKISKYIGVNESLPTANIKEGTIYMKGPYYKDGDTLQEYPSYRMWIYAWKDNTLAWQDNGEFTSITAGIVQETGNSENVVMSQKAVSEKIKGIDEQIQGTPNYIEGYYLNANGELVSANNYRASDFIELNSSSLTDGIIWTYNDYNSSAKLVLYNANKEVIDNFGMISDAAQRKLSQAQLSNAAYVRISFAGNGKLENPSNWEVIYQTGLIGGIIDSLNKEVNRAMLAEAEIDNKYSVLLSGSPNYTKGGYLNAGGDFILDESYCVSDYIALDIPSLTGGIVWTYGLYNANARLVLYSPDKELIDNYGMLPNSTQRKLSQSQLQNAAYARISFENGTVGKLENASNWSIIYESGEEKGLEASKKQLASILGEDSVIKTATILSTGESLTITEFPKSIQCENQLSFDARVTSWNGGLKIGKGTTDWGASYVTIDDTNVVVQVYQGGSEITKYRKAHGLSFDKFVKVLLNQHSHYLSINIITLNGYFEGEIADFEYKFNGYPIVTSLGASLTDITLSAANHSFQYPIWMFGDSYFGADTENREMYWLREKWGYYKFMLNGFAGRDSSEAYNELTRCLRFGCPKYLVWCLGMNDDDLEIYKQTITDLQGKCDDYGITLLLQTIPTVPVRNKEAMNQYIRESKLRYIDVDASVDADSSGNWYGVGTEYNYLSSDGVHPSEYGARAIAAQFLVDMPEIMQYK